MTINVRLKKLRLGLIYGIVAGLSFAIFAWGVDALLLAQANSSFYWVKFVPGLIICILAGGIAGWLTILLQKHVWAFLFWGLLAILYTWLVVWLPLSAAPRLISLINPSIAGWINFSIVQDVDQFWLVSLLIIGLVSIIGGLLEINLIDQAILSPYISGSVVVLVVCIIVFGLAGSATDHLINTNLRQPVQIVNTLLQFAKDNAGVEVPKETARKMHLSAANQLGALIRMPRRLTLITMDENLVMMDVLVDFDGTQAKCSTIFSQPTDCIILTPNP